MKNLFCDVFWSASFVDRNDDEAAAAADLNHDGQELRVDGAVVWVLRVPGDFYLQNDISINNVGLAKKEN